MKSTFFLNLFFLVILAGSVSAHSYVSPGKYEVRFVPNQIYTFEFVVGGTGNYDYKVTSGHASIEILEEKLIEKDTYLKVKVIAPQEIDTPGKVSVATIQVEERVTEFNGMGTQTRVIAPIYFIVPYEGIYLKNSFRVHDINVNETLNLEIVSENLGNKDAKEVSVIVNIYDSSGKVESISFENKDILSGRIVSFKNNWESKGYSEGSYRAEATVEHLELREDLMQNFEVGTLDLDIINVTLSFSSNIVNPFQVHVRNKWNGELSNVYGILEIDYKEYKTLSTKLTPLGLGRLDGFVDTKGLEPGTYESKVTVFYGTQSSEKDIVIEIINEESWFKENLIILGVVILVLLNVLFIISKRKNKEDEKNPTKKTKK